MEYLQFKNIKDIPKDKLFFFGTKKHLLNKPANKMQIASFWGICKSNDYFFVEYNDAKNSKDTPNNLEF